MSFPWAVKTNTRTFRKRDKRLASWRARRNPLRLLVFLALSSTTSILNTPTAKAEPPRTELPNAATQFVAPGSGSADLPQTVGNAMTITQHSQKVILNWQSFNIGRDASVEFKQPDASSAALNRIAQGSPSEIFGRLTANGQVYLLNQNGIIFGSTAQVDTHSLVASALNISDKNFLNGLTNAINQPQAQDKAAFDAHADGWTMSPNAYIQVQSGAVLKTDEGGSIMIFAPVVQNSGEISTPGGQAILAASASKVYLAKSDDPNLRGLLVEVDTGGTVTNGNLGKIVAERGNVTLLGYAVNQDGIVRATTAVNLNGSIRLVARDAAQVTTTGTGSDAVNIPVAYKAGTLTLGAGSLTEVAPDDLTATAADAQTQPDSQVDLVGSTVTMESGARIVAPAGNVQILATESPNRPGLVNNSLNASRFTMASGSSIDVSGLNSAVLPMERNVIAVELRGSQLADLPLQRNGSLYGETVYVDVRKGTPLANVSGEIAKIERPLGERLSKGGTVSIVSEGGVMTDKTSSIDVSGGSIRYRDGFVNTTQLVSQGKVYDIGSADPNRPYDGIYGTYKVAHKKWGVTETFNVFGAQQFVRFESGYLEGKDAGSVAVNARSRDLQGTLLGEVTAGRYQRLPQDGDKTGFTRPYAQMPLGGELMLGSASYSPLGNGPAVGAGDISGIEDFTLQSLTDLDAVGMNRLRIYANGKIEVPEDTNLVLAPGGELTMSTQGYVDVEGDITAHGGKIRIEAGGGSTSAAKLGTTGSIDVSGRWINDGVALNPGAIPQDPAFINGGTVTIKTAGDLALEAGSLIDASGGAQLQRNGKLQYGKGGDITITDNPSVANAPGESSTLRLDGELRAYSFDKGGSLNLTAAGFRIEEGSGDALAHTGAHNTIYLKPGFFERGGFNAYNLTATHTGISIAQNTDVRLRALNRVLGPQFTLQPTGTALNQLGSPGFLPDYQQQPVSLGLALVRDKNVIENTARVEMESGSSIHANSGASITLVSDTNLIVDGTIAAPAGNIQLSLIQAQTESQRLVDGSLTKAIRLGPHGQLLAGAIYQPVPDSSGLGRRLGTVRDGGTVTIAAATGERKGYFIASPGSRIDVSGTTQTLDVSQGVSVTPTAVNGAAGTIDLSAAQGMVLNGDLVGTPGSGAGAAGGALNITLGTDAGPGGAIALTTNPTLVAPGLGETDLSKLNGKAEISPGQVHVGEFDSLALHSLGTNNDQNKLGQIALVGDVQLTLAQRLVLDAPVLASDGGHAQLAAAYVQLGTPTAFYGLPVNPQPGGGSLLVQAQHVDLTGTLALRGFGSGGAGAADTAPVRIESQGDIRLIGGNEIQNRSDGIFAMGQLNSAADIALRANQVYTATATDYTLSVNRTGPDGQEGKITIEQGGASEVPLSAGSRLTLTAADIEQNGTLRVPFGRIEFNASRSLALGAGSVTSVSGAGQLVPFGKTQFGQNWIYPFGTSQAVYSASPEKRISLNAPQVALEPGSVVDVAGGGDLLAREQLPGPGGTTDILENIFSSGPLKGKVNTAFAIVPARHDLYGDYDPFLSTGSPVRPGDTIYIAGGGPLPAGQYAMLPAGYALLPGAYLITPLAKTNSPLPGQAVQQYDGSAVVAGQRGAAGTDARSNLWSAFLVENGAQVRNRAEYLESRADNFFASGAGSLNRDAGQLVINATTALSLGGTLASNATGGRGSEVDILANNLAVVTSYTGTANRVELLDTGLNDLNADSLLLGATREHQGADVALDVQANDVSVESGAALSAPEVMLAAKEQVTVASGTVIEAADGDRVGTPASIKLTGDSAFARISSAGQVRVDRAASPGMSGTINIAGADASNNRPAAVLDASRSITLDASQDTVVNGDLNTHGGSLSLAASHVSLGEAPAGTSGLVLSNDRLSSIEAQNLTLNSRGSIDFYGQVLLNNLNTVALNAAGLGGYGSAGQNVSISADTISLSNRSNVIYTGAPSGSGALNLAAREVTLGETGEHGFAVRGFSNTTVSAAGQIIAKPETDTAVKLHVAGDLTLQTSRITASKGADVSIDTQNAAGIEVGRMTLTVPATIADLAPVTDLGAKLELTATQIDHGTRIELPSGIASLHATGAGGVNLASNASIDVSGRDLHFADTTVGSPGGNASLVADLGNVTVGVGSIDVSGAPSGGDAGKLLIAAPMGAVHLDPAAQISAAAHAGGRAGSFALDTQILSTDFSALNAALNAAGFTDGRQFRLRQGDVTIDPNYTVLAHDLRIAADAGKIEVKGRIDASGSQAGQVALYARDDVILDGSSSIDASATGAGEKGGSVTLGSTAGLLDLQAGANINVAGMDETKAPMDTGTVHLRAARESTNGVSINPIAANISGAERIDIEAFKTYTVTDASIDSHITTIQSDNSAYMTDINVGNIKTALGIDLDARFHLLPGVEIQSTGDLALNNTDWDLLNWRYNASADKPGEAGVLTLRAAGNLTFYKTLSDGIKHELIPLDDSTFSERDVVQTGSSWSYRLAGGADLAAVDPMSVRPGVGDVTLGSGAKLRTGTGNIDIAAGHDLTLADSSAAVYTAGVNRGTGGVPSSGSYTAAQVKELVYAGDFLERGGDVRIDVGVDINGANSHQLINEWLPRAGGLIGVYPFDQAFSLPASWAVAVSNFRQNIGALGGGNVTLKAGGSLDNLSVAIPTTGQPVAGFGTAPSIAGGGDLRIETGGDIRGGVFYVGKGRADMQAGGSVTHAQGESVYPVLALGDGQFTLRARKDLRLEAIVNPTMLPQSFTQGTPDYPVVPEITTHFFTYAPDSAAHLESIAGDTELRGGTALTSNAFPLMRDVSAVDLYPGTLSGHSLQGDIIIGGRGFTLLPAPRGDLELLADGNITTDSLFKPTIRLSDADLRQLPGVLTPAPGLTDTTRLLIGAPGHAATPVHAGDKKPVRIVAKNGTIGILSGDQDKSLIIELSKQARLSAGQDVRNLTLSLQHADSGDISSVEAGGSVLFQTQRDSAGNVVVNPSRFEIAGPGQFYVIAGKDVDLGASSGIISTGRTRNPALPEGGADITIMAGQAPAPAYDAFITSYLANEDTYHERLAQYMNDLASHETDETKAKAFREKPLDSFRTALPLAQQRKFILEVLFNELRESGTAAVESKNYERGFAAIEKLFPGAGYAGDVKSFLSQVTTTNGGDIDLVVPGGLVNAGVAGSTTIKKSADQIGIVAARDGDINAFVNGDFQVNASRVFALDGGDILIWSSTGNIDAGKGAKTALSIPSPKTIIDQETGNTIVEFPPDISGSGIRSAVSTPGREPGDTFLIAPVGVINAGDAGIGSAGNLTIAATAVLGADNIQVGGASVGVPTDTGGLGAGLAGVGDIAATANKMAEDATRGLAAQTNERQGFLGVEVLGFGE